jgi:hypothetical protein
LIKIKFQVVVVGFNADEALFNGAGDAFDDVPFAVLDAEAATALEVADGQIALLKHVRFSLNFSLLRAITLIL